MKKYIKNFRIVIPSLVIFILIFYVLHPETVRAASPDILSEISNKFYTKSESWASILTQAALDIFRWLLILDICLFGIRAVIDIVKGNSVASIAAEFTVFIFYAAFMFVCIKYYKEWSNHILNGFLALGTTLGFFKTEEGDLFRIGLDMCSSLWDAMSIASPAISLGFLVSGLILLFCFALMSAYILVIKCESYVIMNAGIFLLGFGGMKYFKEHSINFMKYGFSVAVKLFVLQLLIGMCSSFMSDFAPILENTPSYRDIIVIIGTSIVMLVLVKTIPQIFSTLIMGVHGSGGASGSSVIAAAGMIGGAVAGGVASGLKAAFNTGSALAGASQVAASNARSGGPTNLGHAYGQMGATLAKAMGESAMENLRGDTEGQTFGRRTASHAARMAQEARESMRASAAPPLGLPENTAIPLSGKSNKGEE